MSTAAKIVTLPWKIGSRLAVRGPVDTCRWLQSHLLSRYREWSLNIETETWIGADELGYADNCHGYEPISYARFDSILRIIEVKPDDVFLDYGCGKGRAVVLAGLKPFRRVVGVELSNTLCEVARDNIERARGKLACRDFEIVCADASGYEVPDDVTVIFLWNSFVGETLASVIEQIRQSAVKSPRELAIIYALPEGEADVMAECPWLPEAQPVPSEFWTGIDVFLYRTQPTQDHTFAGS